MKLRVPDGVRSALAWLVFPLAPAFLGQTYHQFLNFGMRGGSDPREWDWINWVILIGPLLGYGYLAGATLGLPENAEARGLRKWLGRRWVWVAIGPWLGFVIVAVIAIAGSWVESGLKWLFPRMNLTLPSFMPDASESWTGWLLNRAFIIAAITWVGYGWLVVAWALHRRARRLGCSARCFLRGLGAALIFVGSLFGTFWAITEVWRDHFFDRRIVPILIVACTLMLMTGCSSSLTYGEVRRRELFQALLLAWLLGMGLAWRWWGRSRAKL
jgi:hypothetical protein